MVVPHTLIKCEHANSINFNVEREYSTTTNLLGHLACYYSFDNFGFNLEDKTKNHFISV